MNGWLAATALAIAAGAASAQDWPKARPITLTISAAPGALNDTLARLIAPKGGEALGQTIVVDNRPGGGGNIATVRVKRAAPDGYTFVMNPANHAINPSLYANAGL